MLLVWPGNRVEERGNDELHLLCVVAVSFFSFCSRCRAVFSPARDPEAQTRCVHLIESKHVTVRDEGTRRVREWDATPGISFSSRTEEKGDREKEERAEKEKDMLPDLSDQVHHRQESSACIKCEHKILLVLSPDRCGSCSRSIQSQLALRT